MYLHITLSAPYLCYNNINSFNYDSIEDLMSPTLHIVLLCSQRFDALRIERQTCQRSRENTYKHKQQYHISKQG